LAAQAALFGAGVLAIRPYHPMPREGFAAGSPNLLGGTQPWIDPDAIRTFPLRAVITNFSRFRRCWQIGIRSRNRELL